MFLRMDRLVRVLNERGELLFWCARRLARRHVIDGDARRADTPDTLVWLGAHIEPVDEWAIDPPTAAPVADTPEMFWGRAHANETETNPAGVWTLEPIHVSEDA